MVNVTQRAEVGGLAVTGRARLIPSRCEEGAGRVLVSRSSAGEGGGGCRLAGDEREPRGRPEWSMGSRAELGKTVSDGAITCRELDICQL